MWWPFGKTRKVKCRDGSERIVFKNPDDAFPLIAKEWFARLEAAVDMLTKLQAGVGLELNKQVTGFFAQLDEANRSVQFSFRAIYVAYLSNPCQWDGWLTREIHKVIEGEDRLRRLKLEISRIESLMKKGVDEQALGQALRDVQAKLLKSDIEEDTSSEFQKVEKNTSAWMGGT